MVRELVNVLVDPADFYHAAANDVLERIFSLHITPALPLLVDSLTSSELSVRIRFGILKFLVESVQNIETRHDDLFTKIVASIEQLSLADSSELLVHAARCLLPCISRPSNPVPSESYGGLTGLLAEQDLETVAQTIDAIGLVNRGLKDENAVLFRQHTAGKLVLLLRTPKIGQAAAWALSLQGRHSAAAIGELRSAGHLQEAMSIENDVARSRSG
ncbi:MAG TPA: hypothetical protein PKA37_15695 [Planctomycetota bacterium]|nr:hypothetical protein [Planctomycetota bacterium]